VTAYAGFMLLALAVFLFVRRLTPMPPGMERVPTPERLAITLAAFTGGMLGAKAPFALGAAQGPATWSAWLSDGKTVTTGLIGAYLAVELVKWLTAVRVKTGDAYALPLACAMAVGRWGCFVNGCCHGTPTDLPWGRDFGDGVPRHPTQAYESIFHLLMAAALIVLTREGIWKTHRLQFYLLGYGIYRFMTEMIRPEPVYALGLTFYQWASVVLAAGVSAQWAAESWGDTSGQPAAASALADQHRQVPGAREVRQDDLQ
jgi:phosphatidylglycerol---prolipoprotein diacylglyceryl transferase